MRCARAGGDVKQPAAQLLRLGQGVLAAREQGAGPGEQGDPDQGELEPGGVDGELAGLEPPEPAALPVGMRSSTRAWLRWHSSSSCIGQVGRGLSVMNA